MKPQMFDIEDEIEETINIENLVDLFDEKNQLKNTSSILVVTGKSTRRMSGVRSCSKRSKQEKIALKCLEDFLKQELYNNRRMKYIDSEIISIKARWKNKTHRITKKRSCSGIVTALCQARFIEH